MTIIRPSLAARFALALALAALPGTPPGATAAEPVTFHLRVENVSTTKTLKLSNGMTAPAPTSPLFWTVFTGTCPLFTTGVADNGAGLEALAEDGDPSKLVAHFTGMSDHALAGAVAVPNGDHAPGPLLPGKSFDVTFTARPGDRLMLAMMFGQSNDLFYAPKEEGIALFGKEGRPVTGDLTGRLLLWDAGTELNQEPGIGADQGPRQSGPNTGAAENGVVRLVKDVKDGFRYPGTDRIVRVTLSSDPAVRS